MHTEYAPSAADEGPVPLEGVRFERFIQLYNVFVDGQDQPVVRPVSKPKLARECVSAMKQRR